MKQQSNNIIESCLQAEDAFCTAACPFHMNVRDFAEKMSRGAFGAAFKVYRNAVAFPRIVSALCGAGCRSVCPRETCDAAPDMLLLERAAVEYSPNTSPNRYTLPKKSESVAIIGAGPSGLACALRLASRRYEVTVFEKSERIGGHLWDILPPDIFLPDIEEQFAFESYTLKLSTEIKSLNELQGFDAVYIATGAGGSSFGVSPDFGGALASDRPGVFLGGSLTGSDSVRAIADGLTAVLAIERYIKTGAMNHPAESSCTNMVLDPEVLTPSNPVIPVDGDAYTKEEARAEASRCMRCSCDACQRRCDLMAYYKKFPPRIRDEVALTIDPASLDGEETFAKRLMSTCNQCGMCSVACPQSIDMGAFLLEGRRAMHKKDKMPWVFHDFWLRDMKHALDDTSSLARLPAGADSAEYAFFPGCQLGASDPTYVLESYRWLLTVRPDTALWLSCCGAPAVWAGDEEQSGGVFDNLRAEWEALGRPTPIFACPTCRQMFERHLPDVGGIFLFDFMNRNGFTPRRELLGECLCVFDPCSARHEDTLQSAVRELAQRSGAQLVPLATDGERAMCCSWGGHVSIANPDYAKKVAGKRIAQSDLPYIAYCINCRDTFAAYGKQTSHLLDILFDLNDGGRPSPGCNERRKSRVDLRSRALLEFWGEESAARESGGIILHIDEELHRKLAAELILEEDLRQAVSLCESEGRTMTDKATGNLFGYAVIGRTTCWVEYKPLSQNEYKLVNAYSHRMKIDLEETWNGRRTRDDM